MLLQYERLNCVLVHDEVALFNDRIDAQIEYRDWFCGHLHRDIYYYDKNAQKGYNYLYRTTKILYRVDGRIVVYSEFGGDQR